MLQRGALYVQRLDTIEKTSAGVALQEEDTRLVRIEECLRIRRPSSMPFRVSCKV